MTTRAIALKQLEQPLKDALRAATQTVDALEPGSPPHKTASESLSRISLALQSLDEIVNHLDRIDNPNFTGEG